MAERLAELQKTVSHSRLNLWLQCRLKFYFRYVVRVPKPPSPAMHSGSTVHAVLQHWSLARWRHELFSMEELKELFADQWRGSQDAVQIDWAGEEATERESAWRALEHYFTETPIQAAEPPEAVEVGVEADLSRLGLPKLVGIIDLVRAGGRIVDFKVVAKVPSPEQVVHLHEIQLTAYSVLYREETGQKESGLELHHLVKTKLPRLIVSSLPPATERQHARLFRQMGSYRAGLERKDFVPSPGYHCAGCEFFQECRLAV